MVWTDYFNNSPNPTVFDSSVTLEVLNGYSQLELTNFINTVVNKLNEEARNFNTSITYDLAKIKSSIPSNWDSLTNVDRFNTTVISGATFLDQQKTSSTSIENIDAFYRKYYFRSPTQTEVNNLINSPYGLGDIAKPALKEQAVNSLISYGVLNASDYNGLTPEEKVAKLEAFTTDSNAVRDAALRMNNNLIDSDKVTMSPNTAITALIQMKDQGIAKLNSNNTYSYNSGKGIDDLATIDSGKWLTSYQTLEKSWRDSGSQQPFSEYLASQQAYRSETDRLPVDFQYTQDVFGSLSSQLAEQIANQVGTPEAKLTEIQQKIEKLKADAYSQAYNQLNIYKNKEEQQKILNDTFGDSLQSMTTQFAQDFGLKSDFFKIGGLSSSATYGWQKWFEDELAKRYDPSNASNKINSILKGASQEDITLASNFMKDYLQRRFDGSKSLAEFTSYISPSEANPVLEQEAAAIWNEYSSDSYYQLLGSITDPNGNLGNFWTLLKNNWAQGEKLDPMYYKNQSIIDSNGKQQTVEKFWSGLKAIHEVALQKNTTDLTDKDFSSSIYAATNTANAAELNAKIQEYRKWWNEAFADGTDIESLEDFVKLHYNVYTRQLSGYEQLVQPASGEGLKIADGSGMKAEDQERIREMGKRLTYEATKYMSQIQYGEFITPEEYVQQIVGDNSIFEMFGGTALEGASELDMIKEFNAEFASTLSSYAGEQIRNQIRALIDNNQMPSQSQLGVDYIERTKAQALATIQNIIKSKSEGSAVIINNVKAPAPGESLTGWFRNLGLEIVPGDTWSRFKTANGIPYNMTLEQWEKESYNQYGSDGKSLSEKFWQEWARDNGINMANINGFISMVVENPSTAWKTWSNNIVDKTTKSDQSIISALDGASVTLKENELNKSWYSSTNSYTKVMDGWKSAIRTPSSKILNVSTSNLWEWAKENQVDTTTAWESYKQQQRVSNPNFAKDAAGDDFSFQEWADTASGTDVDKFWKNSSSFWVQYLVDKGVADPSSSTNNLKIKSWSDWAGSNNIDLSQYSYSSINEGTLPGEYLDLHYNMLGGKAKVNEAYLDTYFPEFKIIEQQQSSSSESMFDLSAFGLDSVKTGKDDLLGDFNTFDPFKTIGGDFGFDITNPMSIDNYDSKNTQNITGDIQFNFDVTSSYNKKKNTAFLEDFDSMGFGDFGGASFGF